MRKRSHDKRRVAAAVLLGLTATVGVAQAIGWLVRSPAPVQTYSVAFPDAVLRVQATSAFGRNELSWQAVGNFGAELNSKAGEIFGYAFSRDPSILPSWSFGNDVQLRRESLGRQSSGTGMTQYSTDIAVGWPLLVFSMHMEGTLVGPNPASDPVPRVRWGVMGAENVQYIGNQVIVRQPVLAWRPIWVGVTVNAAAYSLFWWVMLAAIDWMRRRSRMRRGLCVECGYDLKGVHKDVPCPECGVPCMVHEGSSTS